MKTKQQNPHIIESSSGILNILCVMDLSLILLHTSCKIYSIPKELKYKAVSLSINNEIQCVALLCLLSRFMTYDP